MKTLLLMFVCLFALCGTAQDVPAGTDQQLENLQEENPDDDALLQHLAFYRKHPLNLNAATADDLQALRLLNGLQIATFLRYRAAFGKLLSVYELQAVPGFDVGAIRKVLPYVFVGAAVSTREDFLSRIRNGEEYALFRASRLLETPKGYNASLPARYLGDRNHLLAAYRYQYKNSLYYGGAAEKDAGEQFFRGVQKAGFDFYSLHLFVRNTGRVKALALGDYTVNLGQGLTQWLSLAFGKSTDVLAVKRQSPVLQPYRSTGEFFFCRGAGLTLGFGRWNATAFVSYKPFSGNRVVDSVERFSSFGLSGYYRTPAEVADRYQLSAFSAGGNLSFHANGFAIGLNAVTHRFSRPMQKKNEPYNFYAFSGSRSVNASVDYSYTFRNVHFFGEAAVDDAFHPAVLQGALVSLSPGVDLSLLYRNLSPAYRVLFGNAFTESTLPTNENGMYTGLVVRPAHGWQVAAYADFYRFPYLKYRVSAPGRGVDGLVQATYAPDKQTEIYLRYRSETKPLDDTGTVLRRVAEHSRQSLRLHFLVQLAPELRLQARTEAVWYHRQKRNRQEGFLTFVEASGRLLPKLGASLRLTRFETGGYDSRIYAYESDVLYSFSIPAFFDKGFRFYFNASYAVSKKITAWLRLARTAYTDKVETGSGLDAIAGNHKTEIKVQVRLEL